MKILERLFWPPVAILFFFVAGLLLMAVSLGLFVHAMIFHPTRIGMLFDTVSEVASMDIKVTKLMFVGDWEGAEKIMDEVLDSER